MAEVMSDPPPQLHSPPTSPTRPKGILKNASQNNTLQPRLTWDEENLAATEIGKDSLMKITEPKTPYVRYNAELDTVEGMTEIPPFHLDSAPGSPSVSQFPGSEGLGISSTESGTPVRPAPPGRASSDRSNRSRSSSRSTSFNLPPDDIGRTEFRDGGLGLVRAEGDNAVVEDEEDMDEETAAKRKEFLKARGRHYSNEAEAMRRAQALMAAEAEDEENSADADADTNMADGAPSTNGRQS